MANTKTYTKGKIGGGVFAAVVFIAAIIAIFVLLFSASLSGMSSKAFGNDVAGAAPTPQPTAEQEKACADTWPIVESDNTNNRWFFEGIASIRDAKTNKEATAAAFDWQSKVRTDPKLLAGAAKLMLQRDVDRSTLSNSENCATEAAVDLDLEIGTAIATSVITPDDVDPNAFNTGVQDGTVIGDTSGGIGGDLSAIQLKLSDGRIIWIMARCGNIATQGPPSLPSGPTDNPERCAYNPQLPPDSPDCGPPNPCPPGNEIPDCAPKSSDPSQWEYPEGKPPVIVTTPPEVTPPNVVTEQPGGGGVTDAPTNPPGSETGVTAPGADPPGDDRDDTPPNEGTGDGTIPEVPATAPPGDPGGF